MIRRLKFNSFFSSSLLLHRTSHLRFYSDKLPSKGNGNEDPNSISNVPSNNDLKSTNLPKHSGGLPSLDPQLQSLMKSPKIQYDPRSLTNNKSYEFEAPKSPPKEFQLQLEQKARGKTKFQRLLPSILLSLGACWGIFAYQYYTHDLNPDVDTDTALLRIDKFLPWIVSFKYAIDDDHYLIELTRRNRSEKLIHNQQLFNGDKLWSVEIMQPDINITRNYTPLPMYVAGVDPYKGEPHLRLVSELEHEGKFVLIVKRYPQGEFSRWLTNLQLLDQVMLRGPIEEYKFPFHPLDRNEERPQMGNTPSSIKPDPQWSSQLPQPENYVFFGAGTGILPLFQLIYSKNPPRGFIDVWYSMHSSSELLNQLKTLNFFAEQCGRVKFHYLIGDRHLQLNDIPQPTLPNFTGGADLRVSEQIYRDQLKREKKLEIQRQLASNKEGDELFKSNNNDKLNDKPIIVDSMNGIDTIPLTNTKIKPESAYQQHILSRLLSLSQSKTSNDLPPPSMAFVCGPEEYVSFVSGKPDRNNLEGVDTGPLGGVLKEKGWKDGNVKRLQ